MSVPQRKLGRIGSVLQDLETQTNANQRNVASAWNGFVSMLLVPGSSTESAPGPSDGAVPDVLPPTPPPKKKKKAKRIETDLMDDHDPGGRAGDAARLRAAEGYRFNTFGMLDQARETEVAIDSIYSRNAYISRRQSQRALEEAAEQKRQRTPPKAALESPPVLAFCQLTRAYQLTQGCFLTVFVTQKCPNPVQPGKTTSKSFDYVRIWNENNVCNFPFLPPGHLCSIEETLDWENLGEHSRALFIVNAITFAYVVAAELFLWIREQWVKRHFRSDRQIAYAALQSEGSPAVDPAVAATLAQLDAMAKALAKGALLLCTGNLIASSQYLLAPDRLFGYRTILHLLANTLLIVWDVIGLFRVTERTEWTAGLALSMLVREPVSYNVYRAAEGEESEHEEVGREMEEGGFGS